MDYSNDYDQQVAQITKAAILQHFGSVRAAADAAGIPYVTLHRKLNNGGLTVSELHRLARAASLRVSAFLPTEHRAVA